MDNLGYVGCNSYSGFRCVASLGFNSDADESDRLHERIDKLESEAKWNLLKRLYLLKVVRWINS